MNDNIAVVELYNGEEKVDETICKNISEVVLTVKVYRQLVDDINVCRYWNNLEKNDYHLKVKSKNSTMILTAMVIIQKMWGE